MEPAFWTLWPHLQSFFLSPLLILHAGHSTKNSHIHILVFKYSLTISWDWDLFPSTQKEAMYSLKSLQTVSLSRQSPLSSFSNGMIAPERYSRKTIASLLPEFQPVTTLAMTQWKWNVERQNYGLLLIVAKNKFNRMVLNNF